VNEEQAAAEEVKNLPADRSFQPTPEIPGQDSLFPQPEHQLNQLGNSIMRFFSYDHLPEGYLKGTSRAFAELAKKVEGGLPNGPEKSTALRKLLEAKDAAVRAALDL
jgi:hypothetical protein